MKQRLKSPSFFRISCLASLLACAGAASAQDYAYDVHGRLITVSYAGGTVVTFCYDDAGNITRRAVGAAAVTCAGPNTAPTANDDTAFGYAGQSALIAVLSNDTDPQNDALSIDSVSGASPSGSPSVSGGVISFTPPTAGAFTFTYTISDTGGLTDSATVTFTALTPCQIACD